MQFLQFVAARADTGAVLPRARVTVYLTNTTTPAALRSKDGSGPLANPVMADDNGACGFAAANGAYDISISSEDATYLLPLLKGVQLYDLTELDGQVAEARDAATDAEKAFADVRATLGAVGWRLAMTIGDREAIPLANRTYGLHVYVYAAGRVWVWSPAGTVGADGVTLTKDDWASRHVEAELLNRGNHTGTQDQDTINGLLDDLERKASLVYLAAQLKIRDDQINSVDRAKPSIAYVDAADTGLAAAINAVDRAKAGLGYLSDQLKIRDEQISALDQAKAGLAYVDAYVESLTSAIGALDRAKAAVTYVNQQFDLYAGYIGNLDDAKVNKTYADATYSRIDGASTGFPSYNLAEGLNWTRMLLTSALLPANTIPGADQKIRINAGFDSWRFHSFMGPGPLWRLLKARYGDGGLGWCGVNAPASQNPNIDPDIVLFYTGAVTETVFTVPSPDTGMVTITTGGTVVWGGSDATRFSAVKKLGFIATPGNVAEYQWNNAGAWTALPLDGSGFTMVPITGGPASGAWQLAVRNRSGVTKLCGFYGENGSPGIIWNKIAQHGMRWQHVAAIPGWAAAAAMLNPALTTMLGATNDQAPAQDGSDQGRTAAQIAADATTVMQAIGAASPVSDRWLEVPPENGNGTGVPMPVIAAALRGVAVQLGIAFTDHQKTWGTLENYIVGASHALLGGQDGTDVDHPSVIHGGPALAASQYTALTGVN